MSRDEREGKFSPLALTHLGSDPEGALTTTEHMKAKIEIHMSGQMIDSRFLI